MIKTIAFSALMFAPLFAVFLHKNADAPAQRVERHSEIRHIIGGKTVAEIVGIELDCDNAFNCGEPK